MIMEEYQKLITIDPAIANGQPCLRGIPPGPPVLVSDIVRYLVSGVGAPQILAKHKHLTVEDLKACLEYLANARPESFVH